MRLTSKTKQQLQIQNVLFIVFSISLSFIVLALSQRFYFQSDWSRFDRNTLSQASARLLQTLDQSLHFRVYASQNEILRKRREELILKYQQVYPKIQYQFIDPQEEPAQAREQGISEDGQVIISLGQSSEKLSLHSEQAYTNAIQRMARSAERWLIFIDGHGERNPFGKKNHDLGDWGKLLQKKGLNIQTLNLASQPIIPSNTTALVIAGPQTNYLKGEADLIRQYLQQGGNLLWLAEPGPLYQLESLLELLPLEFIPGTLVEPNTQMLGINNAFIALATEYPQHEITQNLKMTTLFPQTRPLKAKTHSHWQSRILLRSMERSWSETTQFKDKVGYDKDQDTLGPLAFGLSMSRTVEIQETRQNDNRVKKLKQQRAIVIGDGDFLSNSYLGNGGNADLGLYIANWLSHDDSFISIPAKTAIGQQLQWSYPVQLTVGFGFLLFIPLFLAASGTLVYLKRRRR